MKRTGNRAGRLAQSLKLGTAIASALCMAAAPTQVEAMVQERTAAVRLDIPPQDLSSALATFARLTGQELLYSPELVAGRRSSRVSGRLTPRDALRRLLAGSGIGFVASPGGAFLLSDADMIQNGRASPGPSEAASSLGEGGARNSAASEAGDEEIIVTAQKREQRLQDVPVPVTALRAETLLENNQLRVQDFFTSVPGLNVVPSIQSNQTLSIRGITTGIGNPTVGVTIDDVPFGASTNTGGGRVIPDIDPSELARVEVLRGPQGTYYGASSLGGLLKFVTRDPSTTGFSGRVSAGLTSVHNGARPGYSLRGFVNIPANEDLAFTVSGFSRRDPGFVDNIRTGEEGINDVETYGGRVAARLQVSDNLSVRLQALYQIMSAEGSPSVDPALGDLRQRRVRGSGIFERETQAYSAVVDWDLGAVSLTSITGYGINDLYDVFDAGFLFAAAAAPFGTLDAVLVSDILSRKLSQELRLNSQGPLLDWQVGAFYTNERSLPRFTRFAVSGATGETLGRIQNSSAPETFDEYAAFANATIHVTPEFDVQIGGRQSEIRETFTQTTVMSSGAEVVIPFREVKSNAFTYLFTPQYRFSSYMMIYARFASGYRAGGPNSFPGGQVPELYQPDRTQNYEIGFKADFFSRALSIDTSIYQIDWDDIQFSSLSSSNTSFISNGGEARSRGVEFAVAARPWTGMTASGFVVYNEAEVTEPFPAGSTILGRPGDRLPNSARWSWNIALDQNFDLSTDAVAFAGATLSYVGDRYGPFRNVAVREVFPAYTQLDLRAGVRFRNWTVNGFITNVTDERAALYGGLGALPATAFSFIQPRTIGLTVSANF